MRKIEKSYVKKGGAVLLLLFLAVAGYFGYNMATVATGYTAKILCSCVFVANRSPESGLNGELQNFGYVDTELDLEGKTVRATIAGIAEKTAIYREGLGCTLQNDKSIAHLREKQFKLPAFPYNPDTLPWPIGDIDTLTYENEVDMLQLQAVVDKLFEENNLEMMQNTRAVVIVYKGDPILEKYAPGFTKDTPLGGWSMAKSVTSALVGLLVKEGKLHIQEPAPVDAWQAEGDPRSEITINNLMHMSSGLEFTEKYDRYTDATKMLFASYSAADYAIKSPLIAEPGSLWQYSSGTTNILSKIIRKQFESGEAYWNFPYRALFHKIGMKSARLEADGSGTYVGSSFLFATPRDWARFGQLYYQNGMWDGEQILSESWIDYTQKPAPAAPQGSYGAQFWMNAGEPNNPENRPFPAVPTDMYYASGFEGQNVAIIPSKDLVVVRLGATFEREAWNLGKFVAKVIETLPE